MNSRNEQLVANLLDAGRLPHLLFHGPPGSGKTTLAKKIASRFLYMHLNASEEKSVDVVRKKIKEFCATRGRKQKYIVLDEADALSAESQMALLRIMEQYTENSRFCLICNYISMLCAPILSRCLLLYFAPPNDTQLEQLATRLELPMDGHFRRLAALCGRDMRKITRYARIGALEPTNDVYIHNNMVPPATAQHIFKTIKEMPLHHSVPTLLKQLELQHINVQHMYHTTLTHLHSRGNLNKKVITFLFKTYKNNNLKLLLLCLYSIRNEL